MKINCGPTWEEKLEASAKWHDWFAWYPVKVGSRDCRWLETIERKADFFGEWKYRAIKGTHNG